jgi:hypothetical protein
MYRRHIGDREESLFAVIRKVSRTTRALRQVVRRNTGIRRQLQNDGNERGNLGKLASNGARG